MDDVVLVAVVERTADLPGELAGDAFPEAAVADDVVEHLATADILEHHVVVVLVYDHLAHATDVRVVKKHRQGSFSQRPNLLRGILGGLLRGGLRIRRRCDAAGGRRGDAWEDLDSKLSRATTTTHTVSTPHKQVRATRNTPSPR